MAENPRGLQLTFRQRLTWFAHLFKALTRQYHTGLGQRLRGLIDADAVIVDVGAHAGQHAKLFAAMVPKGQVYAFEPGLYALSILEIVRRWRRLGNITTVPLGLSDKPCVETLHVPLKRSGTMGFGLSHIGADTSGRETVSEEIRLTTLDRFVEEAALKRLDFIKVDIEGWEVNFLKGAMETIEKFKPSLLLEVMHDSLARASATPQQVFDLLLPLGYQPYETFEHQGYAMRRVDGFEGEADYLFVPREKAHLVEAR